MHFLLSESSTSHGINGDIKKKGKLERIPQVSLEWERTSPNRQRGLGRVRPPEALEGSVVEEVEVVVELVVLEVVCKC